MFALLISILALLSFSPDSGLITAPEHATVPAQVPSLSDPDMFARVFEAIAAHNWRYVAMIAVVICTGLVRSILAERVPALKKGKWAWTVAVAGSALAALATHLASSAPVGGAMGILSVLAYGAFVGLAAAGVFKGAKEFANNK